MAASEVIATGVGRFWLEDGLIRYEANEGVEQSQADAEESLRVFARLADGRRRPVVMVIAGVRRLSREARALYTGEEAARIFTAAGIVVARSTMARALFNFIITVSKPAFPSRMFDTVDDAIAWARGHLLPEQG